MIDTMHYFNKMLDFILPPRCIVTGEVVERQGALSAMAWGDLNFIAAPQCLRCGLPFDFVEETAIQESVCGGCMKHPPNYNQARSALVYDDASRGIILGFKHGDQTHAVPSFIPWLERAAGQEMLDQADFLMPVPLHRWRLMRRRFNQSALLVKYLSKESNIPFLLNGLERVRSTPVQGHLRMKERKKNVKNAFAVPEAVIPQIRHKRIILVDDVFTTGATAQECTKALLKNGAGTVDVLTLARVVKASQL